MLRNVTRNVIRNLFGELSDPYLIAGFSPKLVFDPVADVYRTGGSASTFADLVTFTRAGNATYTDATGTLQTASTNVARRNHHVYEGGEWINAGMLVEPTAATNLVTYSNDFTNAAWLKTTGTSVAKDSTGPDGLTSGTTLSDDSGGGTGVVSVRRDVTVSTTTAYTFTVYAKASGLDWLLLNTTGFTTPANRDAYFNLAAGTVGTVGAGLSALIEKAGDGYYRCSITFTTDAADTSGTLYVIAANSDGSFVVDRDGTSSILIYQSDFIAGSVPMSPIQTAGSTATRAAETRPYAAAKLPYSATGMSFRIKGRATYADLNTAGQQTLYDRRVDANNRITVTLDTDGAKTGTFTLTVVNGGVSASVATTGQITPGINKPFSIAWRVTSSQINIALNGTAATAVSSPGVPSLAAVGATMASTGTRELESAWDVDLADAGIAEASA